MPKIKMSVYKILWVKAFSNFVCCFGVIHVAVFAELITAQFGQKPKVSQAKFWQNARGEN